jgi:hypothetical protein
MQTTENGYRIYRMCLFFSSDRFRVGGVPANPGDQLVEPVPDPVDFGGLQNPPAAPARAEAQNLNSAQKGLLSGLPFLNFGQFFPICLPNILDVVNVNFTIFISKIRK